MNIDVLYEIYNKLTEAGDKVSELSNEYLDAIEATKLGPKEKRLSTDIIKKFFASFPSLQSTAINAIFDLLDEDDIDNKKYALKALASFCNDSTTHISKITTVLGQMLYMDDASVQTCATNVLIEVLRKQPALVIQGMFDMIHNPNLETPIRFRCIQFIVTKIKVLDASVMTKEIQDLMILNVRATLKECHADEFVLLMNYLVTTNVVKTLSGQKELSDFILQQIEVDKEFKPYNIKANFTNRLVTCVKFILPFYSAKNESTLLVNYYCNKVLAQWELIGALNNGIQYQTAIAQQLATISQFCGALETPTKHVEAVFNVLLLYMPEPPEDTSNCDMPEFNFSIVESLLFAFHALARQCPDFLTEDQARLKDFRARLLYFSRGVQGCLKVLQLESTDKVFNAEEKRIREMCPQLLQNIQTLVKDLFYTPPVYKCKVTLSFNKKEVPVKPVVEKKAAEAVAPVVGKRHAPITFDSSNGSSQPKHKRGGGGGGGGGMTGDKIYKPPSGKFSHNFNRGRGGSGGFRARGRGGFRGGYRNH